MKLLLLLASLSLAAVAVAPAAAADPLLPEGDPEANNTIACVGNDQMGKTVCVYNPVSQDPLGNCLLLGLVAWC